MQKLLQLGKLELHQVERFNAAVGGRAGRGLEIVLNVMLAFGDCFEQQANVLMRALDTVKRSLGEVAQGELLAENLAERVGFEPTIPVKVCPHSRRIVSTTHAPLRINSCRLPVPSCQ